MRDILEVLYTCSENPERDISIYMEYLKGHFETDDRLEYKKVTYRYLAEKYNLSKERIYPIIEKKNRRLRFYLKRHLGEKPKKTKNGFCHTLYFPGIELSSRVFNCLKWGKINTLKELLAHTRNDLLKLKNLGKKAANEIEAELKSIGLNLKGGTEE